jgi:DNA polymerase III sliding clamp (beta) subunit (PCNA family)
MSISKEKEIAQFTLDDGTPFLVEIEESESASVKRVANDTIGAQVVQAKQSFETALDQVIPVASAALNRVRRGLTTPADEVEIKFGVKLTAEAGAIIASVGGEVNFEFTLKWKQSEVPVKVNDPGQVAG